MTQILVLTFVIYQAKGGHFHKSVHICYYAKLVRPAKQKLETWQYFQKTFLNRKQKVSPNNKIDVTLIIQNNLSLFSAEQAVES